VQAGPDTHVNQKKKKKEALYHVEILKGRLSKQATPPSYGYQDISPT
jgi:hypothetical protein